MPRTLFIGWSAQAALYHRHGVPRHALVDKAFGVFKHSVRHPGAGVLRGFDGDFWVSVSRHTEVRAKDVPAHEGIDILAAGDPSKPPKNYYAGGDVDRTPRNRWRPFAHMLFANWLAEIDRARVIGVDVAA